MTNKDSGRNGCLKSLLNSLRIPESVLTTFTCFTYFSILTSNIEFVTRERSLILIRGPGSLSKSDYMTFLSVSRYEFRTEEVNK